MNKHTHTHQLTHSHRSKHANETGEILMHQWFVHVAYPVNKVHLHQRMRTVPHKECHYVLQTMKSAAWNCNRWVCQWVSQSVSYHVQAEQNSYSDQRTEKRWKNYENEVQSLNNLVFQFQVWMADIAIDSEKIASHFPVKFSVNVLASHIQWWWWWFHCLFAFAGWISQFNADAARADLISFQEQFRQYSNLSIENTMSMKWVFWLLIVDRLKLRFFHWCSEFCT